MKRLLICSLLVLFLIGIVSAAGNEVTLLTPAASETISGATYILNSSVDTNTLNLTNATYYYSIDGTTWVYITSLLNTTSELIFNTTWDSTGVVDSIGLTFNVTIANESGVVTTGTSATVNIDNGEPTATWASSSPANDFNILNMDTFTAALDADSTIGIENCTVTINSQTQSITGVGEACSATYNLRSSFEVTTAGTYAWTITAIDANGNETASSSRNLKVLITPGGGSSGTSADVSDGNGLVQQTFLDDDVAPKGENWFTKMVDAVVNFFKFKWLTGK